MPVSKIDHSLADAPVSQSVKGRIASAFNRCEEAASDLERYLAHAAADATGRDLRGALYDAAKAIGDLPFALRDALESIDAFVEIGGTARGAIRRAALEARVAIAGHDDATILEGVGEACLRALSVYDEALEAIVKAPPAFADLLVQQRRTISHLTRELAARSPR